MKVMFVVYHDIQTEARSQEILECAKKIGETIFVSYSKPLNSEDLKCIVTGNGKRNLNDFIRTSIKAIKKENPDILILHDNYTAPILWWINLFKKEQFVIYDSSELYIEKKKYTSLKGIAGNFLREVERKNLKHADVVLAANIERAEIMKEYFHLKKIPIVFDNIHRINDEYNFEECRKKYNTLIQENTFNIVYAGGIAKHRLTFELAEIVNDLGKGYQLIIAGQATKKDEEHLRLLMHKKNIENVFYVGFIPRDEWRFLLNMSQISVSVFAQNTVNNIYCASGKVYESIFEGTPLLTSENPPLKRICEDFNIGKSTNDFINGIKDLKENYDYYVKNVNKYKNQLNMEERLEGLYKNLMEEIENAPKLKS